MPQEWATLTVEKQTADPESTFSFFRHVIKVRKERTEFRGEEIDWLEAPRGALMFRRRGGGAVCALNAGRRPIPLPPGELIVASAPLVNGQLAPDAAAWLA
jgi:alpha-glucosidase